MKKERFYSLDVFRGATVSFMILVNYPGTWEHVFPPLLHAEWHGTTLTDLVYPFFLFAVGNSMSFGMGRLKSEPSSAFWEKVIKRTLLIFFIGLFLNWWPFYHWENNSLLFNSWVDQQNPKNGVRILGVLQRIALAYFFASVLVYYFKERTLIGLSFIALVFYWILHLLSSSADPYSFNEWFGTAIDKKILGEAHMYKGEGVPFDPEGIISTLPAIVQVVFGYLVGKFIIAKGSVNWLWKKEFQQSQDNNNLVSGLMVTGFIILLLGLAWSLTFPINKKIWSSSYVLYTTGYATLTIGLLVWWIEIGKAKNKLTKFFDVFGKNPLFIYMLSELIPEFLDIIRLGEKDGNTVTAFTWSYESLFSKTPGPPELGSLSFSICFLAILWCIAYFMDRKKIYIKV